MEKREKLMQLAEAQETAGSSGRLDKSCREHPEVCRGCSADFSESMSDLIMEYTPNMVFVVDREMKIRECSSICEAYFGKSRSQAREMYLFEFLDPTDFQWVYQTHQSIRGKKVTYPEYGLTALLTIVYIEKKDLVLATIVDITERERLEREEYAKKLRTVELANEVIRRQMTVAQEIAGLLGETTAQTKITLMDLCDSLLGEGEEKGAKL